MSSPIAFTVVPADTYFLLKMAIDPEVQPKIISMEVLYNDDNSVRTVHWKKHEVSSAEISISSVKVPIALADRGSKWTFIVVLTYQEAGKYITLYSERSQLEALIKAPPVIHLSPIDNDNNRSTSLEDSYYIDASFIADSLDSIDAMHLVLYDDSNDLGTFRKIIFTKKDDTNDFFIEGDTTAYTPVKNEDTGNYEVKLLIGKLDLGFTYEIAALSLFKMLFSEISNTILFSPDLVPFLKRLENKKQDISIEFNVNEGDVEVGFSMYSPGVPALIPANEKLDIFVENYTDAERSQLIGSGRKSLLTEEKTFEYYDNTNKDDGNSVAFKTGDINSDAVPAEKLVRIGEINYLRIYVENSYGKSIRYYDIEFQPIKKDEAPLLSISEIKADTREIGIKWTPSSVSNKNDISTWKVTRSRDTTTEERLTNPDVLTKYIETIEVPNTEENKENGDFIYTFNSLEVDKKFTFQVYSVIRNDFNFTTWNMIKTKGENSVMSLISGNQSNKAFGVAYDTYGAPTVTADTAEANSDGQCKLQVSIPAKPSFIDIDSIETEYTGSDGSSGTQSTTYDPNGTTVTITGLSNSVEYIFKVYVKASLKTEAVSNDIGSTQTKGTESADVPFVPWRKASLEVEFSGTDVINNSFKIMFVRQITTGNNNTNIKEYISRGTLKLQWRQPDSLNEIKSGFVEILTSQPAPVLADPSIEENLITYVTGELVFPNPNNIAELISIKSDYETVCVKSGAYTPTRLTLEPDYVTGTYGSADIRFENPLFDISNLFNSADQLDKTNLAGFELKLYSKEDSDFISLPSSVGYQLTSTTSEARSKITSDIASIYQDQAAPTPMTPEISALGYGGWYWKKTTNDGVNKKINWYLVPETKMKVSDLSQLLFNLKLINKASVPFITVYTKATGTGDAFPGFYKSKRNYELLDTRNLVNGTNYCCYMKIDPTTATPVYEAHTSVALSKSNVASTEKGLFAGTEEIGFFSFGTDSGAAVGNVEFICQSVGVNFAGTTETFLFTNAVSGYQLTTNISRFNLPNTSSKLIRDISTIANPTPMTSQISALRYDGFYYKKAVSATTGSASKINWYFYPGTTVKVSDLKQIFFKLKLINKTSAPFVNVYTKKDNITPNFGSFYKSRRTYDLININPFLADNAVSDNEDYFCYVNFNSNTSVPVPDTHKLRQLRISDATANLGPFASSEIVESIAFSTNSAAGANTVEFIVQSLSLQYAAKTETFVFSNINSGVFDKDIDTPGRAYQYKYNYKEAELGKTLLFMVEAIYNNTNKTRAPVIGGILAYQLPQAPAILGVTSIDLKTLEIDITPPHSTQLGGGSLYGYLVEFVGTGKNGASVPTAARTILDGDLADKTKLRITDLSSNVQYVASIRTLIDLKTPAGDNIRSASSLSGPARYCLHSVAELEVKSFRVSNNGFNFADTVTADQLGASAELKWDAIVDGGYDLKYTISQVDASGEKLPGVAETIVPSSEAITTKVLSGLKFVSGLSYFSITASILNLNTAEPADVISGAVSSASAHLYDSVTEAVKNLGVVAGDKLVEVSWDLITQSTRNTNVANYRVCFWPATGSINVNDPASYAEVGSAIKTKTISNLPNGTEFKFAVLYSLVEDPLTFFFPDNGYLFSSATPYGAPSTPTISADTTVGIKQTAITVNTESVSNGSAVFKYNIYRKNITTNEASFSLLGSVAKVDNVLTTYVDTNVAVSSTYDYYIRPVYKNTNNNVDIEGPQSNTVRKIIFVKFAIPSQPLTFQAISESDFIIFFKSLKDELTIGSNSSASTGFVSNIVSTGLFGLIKVPVLDAKLRISCTYLNGQQTITVTKEYANSVLGDGNNSIKFSDLRGTVNFTSGTICSLTVSLLGKNRNDNQYVATDSVPVFFQPFGKATFNTFKTHNGIRNVAVKVVSDPATTDYKFGVFSVFKCKVFVGYNGFLNNNGYSNFSSADLTSTSGSFLYAVKDSDLGSSNPNRNFKFVITMETVGNYPSTNVQTSNEVNVIVTAESSSNPDPVVVVKESFYYSSDLRKAYVKVDTSYAPLVSLIAIFKLQSQVTINNSTKLELYVDSRYPVENDGVTYQVKDISSNPENQEDKFAGVSTFEIPLVGFTSNQVSDLILLVATPSGLSRPNFVGTKSGNTLAFGKGESVYFSPGTDLGSIVRPF
jgi:hypothetical protein